MFKQGDYIKYVDGNRIIRGHVLGYSKDKEYLVIVPSENEVKNSFLFTNISLKEEEKISLEDAPLSIADNHEVYVTKELTFDSSHNLLAYDGPCANLHGHTYKLQVTLKGLTDENGFLLDFKDLKRIMKEKIKNPYDHKYLNDLMPFNTTAENMVKYFAQLIMFSVGELYGDRVRLAEVKLWETPTSFATIKVGE